MSFTTHLRTDVYGVHMDIATATARRVTAALEAAGETAATIAPKALIPRPTLLRRLAGVSPFNVDELDRIAAALGVSATDLLGTPDLAETS